MQYSISVAADTMSARTTGNASAKAARILAAGLALAAATVLTACGGGSGADVEENPGSGTVERVELHGPGAEHGRRAVVQDQPVGQRPRVEPLRHVPQRRRRSERRCSRAATT